MPAMYGAVSTELAELSGEGLALHQVPSWAQNSNDEISPAEPSFEPKQFNGWCELAACATSDSPAMRGFTQAEPSHRRLASWGAEVTWNHAYERETWLDTDMLMSRLDMTDRRLNVLFGRCGGDREGLISLDQLLQGLQYQEIILEPQAGPRLAQLLGPQSADGRFEFSQFVQSQQLLSLAELLVRHRFDRHHLGNPAVARRLAFRCIEYKGDWYLPWRHRPSGLVCGGREMFEFFFGRTEKRPEWIPPAGALRLVSLTGERAQLQDGEDRV